jgi:hypothetical protein
MAFKTLKELFDSYSNIKVDKAFVTKVVGYVQGFINKNDVHTQHFGSGLVGVLPVRYVDADARYWLEDVLGIDDVRDAQDDIWKIDGIDRKWRVASDIVNLSFGYVLHRIGTEKGLDEKYRQFGMQETLVMCMAKHMCSLLTHRFKFPADELIAQQLYESLDNKSHLKRYGTWLNMIRAHSEEFLDPKTGIHTQRGVWKNFTNTKQIIYMTGDIQDRLAGQINLLTEKFHEIKDSNDRILVKASINNIDGEDMLAEYVSREKQLLRDMEIIAQDPRDFIKQELIDAVVEVFNTADERFVRKALEYYIDNFRADERYPQAMRSVVIYVMTEAKQGRLSLSNLPAVIKRLASILRASRTKKQDALRIKEDFRIITEEAIPTARDAIKTSTQISLIAYIALRMLTIPRYR